MDCACKAIKQKKEPVSILIESVMILHTQNQFLLLQIHNARGSYALRAKPLCLFALLWQLAVGGWSWQGGGTSILRLYKPR